MLECKMHINDILTPRKEVIKDEFQGVVQSHKVEEKEERLESVPKLFFEVTYPSNALRNVLDRVNEKLRKKESQGSIVLAGPYGSGKSHALITLYHLFKHQNAAKDWLKYWNIKINIPTDADAVILSAQKTDANLLWKPIFEKAGKEELLQKVKRYPTTDIIEDLVGNGTLAIILDEIESWYISLEKENPDFLERNRFFIQNLLQVANGPDKKLFVFISSLGKGTSLDEIIERTNPPYEDLSATGDREDIIMHRLFETEPREVEEEKVRRVVKSYINEYETPIELEEPGRYLEKMIESYPFHPQLLSLLDRIYETAAERQNVRGEMRVLADMLAEWHNKTDLLLLSDINEKAFTGINRELVSKFEMDVDKRISDITHADRLLRCILMFSLDDKSPFATESEILLGTLKPSEGMTLTQLSMSLQNMVGTAHYLHKEDSRYALKTEENVMALVEKEKKDLSDERGRKELTSILKKSVFDNQAYIFETEKEEIPDDRNLSFVVIGSYGTKEDLRKELESFYRGREFQNTIVFIAPKDSPLKESSLIEKSKRVVAARNLVGRVEDEEGKLKELIREEKKEIIDSLKEKYGYWVKWSPEAEKHEVDIVLKPVRANIEDVREKIETDESLVEEKIMDKIKGKEEGVKVGRILKDFKKLRKLPLLSSNNIFYNLVRRLCGEKIVIQGERSKFYTDREPTEIKDDYVLIDPQYVPPSKLGPEEGEPGTTKPAGKAVGKPPTPKPEEKAKIISRDAEGNSPRVILSKLEPRLNEKTDTISEISLTYSGREFSKEEVIEFLKNLPDGESITARLEVKRRED